MSSNTKARVTILENILRVPVKGEQLSVCDRLDALSAETTVIRNEISNQRDVVLIHVEELAATLDAQGSAVRETQSQLETEIALLKKALCGLPREGEVATKVKVPTNTALVVRDSLKKLKKTGTVKEYVKTFSSLTMDIKNMLEEDKLFNFMSGLQPWAQLELKR